MKKFTKTTFAAAAIIAALFIAGCDNGGTTTNIINGKFVLPDVFAGDGVIWTNVETSERTLMLADDDGGISIPGAGYYTYQPYTEAQLKKGAEGKIAVTGAVGDVFRLYNFSDNKHSYAVVATATELPAENGKVYYAASMSTLKVADADGNVAVTGAVGDVFSLSDVVDGGTTYQFIITANKVPGGTAGKIYDPVLYAAAANVKTAAGSKVTGVTDAAAGDVYKVDAITTNEITTTYQVVTTAEEVPTAGATDKVVLTSYAAAADVKTAADSKVTSVTDAAVGDVYAVDAITTDGISTTYQVVTTAEEVPTAGATDKVVLTELAAAAYFKGAGGKITPTAVRGALVEVTQIVASDDAENTGYKIVKKTNELPAVNDKYYTVTSVASAGDYYNFN